MYKILILPILSISVISFNSKTTKSREIKCIVEIKKNCKKSSFNERKKIFKTCKTMLNHNQEVKQIKMLYLCK